MKLVNYTIEEVSTMLICVKFIFCLCIVVLLSACSQSEITENNQSNLDNNNPIFTNSQTIFTINEGVDSFIHPSHLKNHNKAKLLMLKYFKYRLKIFILKKMIHHNKS